MTFDEVMQELEKLGSEQTKSTYIKHGAMEPLFGVKTGDLKKLVKTIGKDQALSEQLFESGNSDAMYLAGLCIDPKLMSKELLQQWVSEAYSYGLAEFTVAGVAAKSLFALELAREWIDSPAEMVAACGWSVWSLVLANAQAGELSMDEIGGLLERAGAHIHGEQNRVRYAMNGFVISVGIYVPDLMEEAKETAVSIGKVHVNMGKTACKVPLASEYIEKALNRRK
ncbi:DNA alkylation repair protein [Paenibacillus sp. GCM10027627]|uniref:DNA alkylation repair protein n=1 Tax=unclassified Paenibacillus TaxID=185978 RepID=UPI0036383BA8